MSRRKTIPVVSSAVLLAVGVVVIWGRAAGGDPPPFRAEPASADVCRPLRDALHEPDISQHDLHARLDRFLRNLCYQRTDMGWVGEDGIHFTGDRHGPKAGPTHAWVRVWYSPEVVSWLESGRAGELDERAVIIKEQFSHLDDVASFDRHATVDPPAPTTFEFGWWTAMVRRPEGAFDGWYWDENFPRGPIEIKLSADHAPDVVAPSRPECNRPWPDQRMIKECGPEWGFGPPSGCLRCHASAKSDLTFASLDHTARNSSHGASLADQQVIYNFGDQLSVSDAVRKKAKKAREAQAAAEAAGEQGLAAVAQVANLVPLVGDDVVPFVATFMTHGGVALPPDAESEPRRFPDRYHDHVPAPAGPPSAAGSFLTSDQCWTCHDGVSQLGGAEEIMKLEDGGDDYLNISPFAEWSVSMMGLAGRDPVFHAQREWEVDHRGECPDNVDITDTCYRCHGVMGQRQLKVDRPGAKFTHDMVYAGPSHDDGKYGALARDGISCTVCHRMTKDDLGTPASYTGQFTVGPGDELYGPYTERVRTLPMKASLGIEPKGRTGNDDVLSSSAMCGSCHNVKLPKLEVGKCATDKTEFAYEQATFLEWQNSQYAEASKCQEGDTSCVQQTCQGCHMPRTLPSGAPIPPLKVAGVEDQDYPTWNVASTHAHDQVVLEKRKPYARHTLVGLNLFVMEMFRQFPRSLGVDPWDYMSDYGPVTPRMDLARAQVRDLADSAARVDVLEVVGDDAFLKVRVRVTNNAGHKLPSGVGFRRAFLAFEVLDDRNQVLWASGRTDAQGVILGGDGQPLETEFSSTRWEPHHSVIDSEDQVQIYEERILDSKNRLTTSFLGIWKHVKDNRLLPKGWEWNHQANRENGEVLHEVLPHGVTDPEYGAEGQITDPLCGCDEIVYRIPRDRVGKAQRVVATLYYQSIPPYYLRDRFTLATSKNEARRLFVLASHLNTRAGEGSPIADWKLKIASGDHLVE